MTTSGDELRTNKESEVMASPRVKTIESCPIGPFDPKTGSFASFQERLELWFDGQGVTDSKMKRGQLMSAVGSAVYETVKGLVLPKKVSECTYEQLVKAMEEHYETAPNEIVERYNFYRRTQKEEETVADFIAELRKLSQFCNFVDLEKALRDRLVCGIRDESTRKKLLAEKKLTFHKACDIAKGEEAAGKGAAAIVLEEGEIKALNKTKQKEKKPQQETCFRCKRQHSANDCWFKEKTCRRCGEKGHIQKACNNDTKKGKRTGKKINVVKGDESSEEEDDDVNQINTISDLWHGVWVKVNVEGSPIEMEVDSGAAYSVMSEDDWNKLKSCREIESCKMKLCTWVKKGVKIKGKVKVQVELAKRKVELPLIITKEGGKPLLGRNWFQALGIEICIPGINALAQDRITQILRKFPGIFKEGLGTHPAMVVNLELKEDAKPVFMKHRAPPVAIRERPLLGVFNPKKSIDLILSARMERWCQLLATYDYEIVYRKGKDHGNADGLSRLPLDALTEETEDGWAEISMLETEENPVQAKEVQEATKKDPMLMKVKRWVLQGWPERCPEEAIRPYFLRRGEITIEKDVLLRGTQVIIPKELRGKMVKSLHSTHLGIVNMKVLARNYMWWPKMDLDLERAVRECEICQIQRNNPPKAPVCEGNTPEKPWERLHVDFAGPHHGNNYLIVVDAKTKWLEVVRVKSQSSEAVIKALRRIFCTHGIPAEIFSDNGTAFVSKEIQKFYAANGIKGITSSPWHPASNGQAERMVQTTKKALEKFKGDVDLKLARFLMVQHLTPNQTTGKAPCELLMGRRIRNCWSRLHPEEIGRDKEKDQKEARKFKVLDKVYARSFTGDRWVKAVVVEVTGPVSYKVQLEDGSTWRRHVNQLIGRIEKVTESNMEDTEPSSQEVVKGYDDILGLPSHEEGMREPPVHQLNGKQLYFAALFRDGRI
uniref:RNA-directed DNA polymerase n=1 Tax=Lutzomyia longipalpis TaxID=7200 RepID=A0A1B0GIL7_LUTLO